MIVPVYNEENTLATIVEPLHAVPFRWRSSRSTTPRPTERRVLERCKAEGLVDIVVHQPETAGRARRSGRASEHATGDVIVVQDADLEYDPEDFARCSSRSSREGRRRLRLAVPRRRAPGALLLALGRQQVLTLLSNMFTNLNLTDMETCYKVVRRR